MYKAGCKENYIVFRVAVKRVNVFQINSVFSILFYLLCKQFKSDVSFFASICRYIEMYKTGQFRKSSQYFAKIRKLPSMHLTGINFLITLLSTQAVITVRVGSRNLNRMNELFMTLTMKRLLITGRL